jgi:hypothetical protein
MHLTAHLVARLFSGIALAMCLALALSGCTVLGISDPTVSASSQNDELASNSIDFDDMIITLNTDTSSWVWSSINNNSSTYNGNIVIAIPIHLENNGDGVQVLNSLSCKIIGPDGLTLPDISSVVENDILDSTSVGVGSSVDGTLHVLYRGAGTYTIQFDNMLGAKAELSFDVVSASSIGIRALPSSISSIDAGNAIPSGTSFDAEGLTITLSADRSSYNWVQASAPGDSYWDGRWCVGIPVTITNLSNEDRSISTSAYEKFNPSLEMQGDPAPYFSDDITNVGTIPAGQTVVSMIYFSYDGDGNYYIAMDNNGTSVLATVLIAQYY